MSKIKFKVPTMELRPLRVSAICIISLIASISLSPTEAQVVSHELRRLAVSTNQFGIDALKALDKIEPPDKVLVFCPACLSSSLMMVMMGSSKYQVVSALRHALYVWSMKPQEINRGFKDIFEHIGLNQYQQLAKPQATQSDAPQTRRIRKRSTRRLNHINTSKLAGPDTGKLNAQLAKSFESEMLSYDQDSPSISYLSLPKLIKLKETLERTSKTDPGRWWHMALKAPQSPDNYSSFGDLREPKQSQSQLNSTILKLDEMSGSQSSQSSKFNPLDSTLPGDLSQMSAISNIYIQRGLAMNYNYNLLLRRYYKTVIHPVDFVRNGEETRQHINSLVAASTEGKIKDLVGREIFGSPSSPRIMVISTFHFRGTLDIHMKSKESSKVNLTDRPSHRVDTERFTGNQTFGKQQQDNQQGPPYFILTESTLLKHGQFPNMGCSVIEIPFNNRLISLVIVMPNHNNLTELLLTKLNAQVLSDMISSLKVKKISIEIPVIKFDRGPINVEGLLRELGLSNLFFGDKTYTTETGLNKWLRPSDIIHETSIDIGTINPNWGQPEDRLKVGAYDNRSLSTGNSKGDKLNLDDNHIKLDKPFFYFVLDTINGLVLTMGRIRQ